MMRLSNVIRSSALAASLLAAAGAPAAPLRVGGFVVAPLIMGTPDAPLHGALRDFMERTVVHRGVPLQWMQPTSLRRATESLRNGTLDVLLLTSGATDRGPGIGTFKWTYLRTRPQLALRLDAPLREVPDVARLAGLRIGWVDGSPLPPGLDEVDIEWQLLAVTDWQAANLRKLQARRVDAVFFENEYSPRYYARTTGVAIRLVRLPVAAGSFFMAYSLRSDPDDIARFDRVAGAAFAGKNFSTFLDRYVEQAPRTKPGR